MSMLLENSTVPGLLKVDQEIAVTKNPKIVDFSDVNLYPSKYKFVNGELNIRSIIIENIENQKDVIIGLKTTVFIGDIIKVDFKFGHFEHGEWHDIYVKGHYKVKRITPLAKTCEILFLVSKVDP